MDSSSTCCVTDIVVWAIVTVTAEEQHMYPFYCSDQTGRFVKRSVPRATVEDLMGMAYHCDAVLLGDLLQHYGCMVTEVSVAAKPTTSETVSINFVSNETIAIKVFESCWIYGATFSVIGRLDSFKESEVESEKLT